MLRYQEIQYGLHRCECAARHLHEHGRPMGHGAVPQPWALEGLEVAPVHRFARDEHGLRVNEAAQVESVTTLVADADDQIHGVEMRGGPKNRLLLLSRRVHLGCFDDLQRQRAVSAPNPERPAARLPGIADDTAHAHRTVECLNQPLPLFSDAGRLESCWNAEAQVLARKPQCRVNHRGLGWTLQARQMVEDVSGLPRNLWVKAGP